MAVSRPNIMAPWHLLTRMALAVPELRTAQVVRQLGLAATVPDLPERPSVPLFGCAGLVALGVVGSLVGAAANMFFLAIAIPFVLVVAWKMYGGAYLRWRLWSDLCDLHASLGQLVNGLWPTWNEEIRLLDRQKIFSTSEWTLHMAFTPLLTSLEQYLDQHADFSHVNTRDEATRRLAERIRKASVDLDAAIAEKHDLEHFTDPPEVAALKQRHDFMQAEIRRVGRQILAGLRVRSASLRLFRCPACAGPMSSETSSCPYCGSGVRYS